MKSFVFATLLALSPLALHAEDMTPVADVIIGSTLPYVPDVTEGKYTKWVTPGENGAPEVLEEGMILRMIDKDDPTLTRLARVAGDITDNGTPTGKKIIVFFDME